MLYPLLPGGGGEHDFSPALTRQEICAQLDRFAENCGGMFVGGELHCSTGVWRLYFEGDRLSKVTRGDGQPYWDANKARVYDGYGGCQGANYDQPDLTDEEADVERFFAGYHYASVPHRDMAYDRLLELYPQKHESIVKDGWFLLVDLYSIPGGLYNIFDKVHYIRGERDWKQGTEYFVILPDRAQELRNKYRYPLPSMEELEQALRDGWADLTVKEFRLFGGLRNGNRYCCYREDGEWKVSYRA